MKIPFFRYPHVYSEHKDKIDRRLREVIERGGFILQDELFEFERKVAEFCSVKHAIGVANGTDSLILALRAAGIEPGDEVIMASHTYIATPAAAHFSGGVPVLVDCGEDRLIDPLKIEEAMTDKARFIMPTQLNGRVCDMDAILSIASRHNLTVIEDAAQALGAKYKGKCAGTFGFAGSISLYPAKLLGCFGDGGLLLTDDDETAATLRCMRDHGRDENGDVVMWGVNSRLDTLNAAVCLAKFDSYPTDLERRREIATMYQERLGEVTELGLPPAPSEGGDNYDCFQNYEIDAENRDALKAFLADEGIGTIIQWAGTPVHQFTTLGLPKVSLPRTELFFTRCLLLPMNTSLSDSEVEIICDAIKRFYQS